MFLFLFQILSYRFSWALLNILKSDISIERTRVDRAPCWLILKGYICLDGQDAAPALKLFLDGISGLEDLWTDRNTAKKCKTYSHSFSILDTFSPLIYYFMSWEETYIEYFSDLFLYTAISQHLSTTIRNICWWKNASEICMRYDSKVWGLSYNATPSSLDSLSGNSVVTCKQVSYPYFQQEQPW